MEIIKINAAPVEVQKAFEHVRSFFPDVISVEFDKDCRWLYSTSDDAAILSFGDVAIDQEILEDAADAQYNIAVPVTYVL